MAYPLLIRYKRPRNPLATRSPRELRLAAKEISVALRSQSHLCAPDDLDRGQLVDIDWTAAAHAAVTPEQPAALPSRGGLAPMALAGQFLA